MNALRFASLLILFALALSLSAQTVPKSSLVTPVTGESWLNHLQRSFDVTSMGRTGRLGPQEPLDAEGGEGHVKFSPQQMVKLLGADLYRMNCRTCHGENGMGAPPEINSVINPVRAGSVMLILERAKGTGINMSRAEAVTLAKQSQESLLQRLHNGGQDMPPFFHLREPEIQALLAYLNQLADVPRSQNRHLTVRVTHTRVGEYIVKSTCHICHSAVGANPDPRQLAEGIIPPLSTLTARVSREGLIRKVTRGAPVTMGDPPQVFRGRMPVFNYLSDQEAADVYDYLRLYGPSAGMAIGALSSPAESRSNSSGLSAVNSSRASGTEEIVSRQKEESRYLAIPWVMGMWSTILIIAGVVLTFHQFRKLTAERKVAVGCIGLEGASAGRDGTQGRRRNHVAGMKAGTDVRLWSSIRNNRS